MRKNISKLYVTAVITLFLILCFIPATNTAESIKKADLTEIEVTDYNPDGSITTKIVTIKKSDMITLKNKLVNSESIEENLNVLKEYNLVSKDQTPEDLYQGMLNKADLLGLDIKSSSIPKIRPPIVISLFNKVTSVSIAGFSTRIGISPIIRIINLILKLNLPRLDIIDTSTSLFGILSVKNPIAEHVMVNAFGFYGHIGFVGTSIKFPIGFHIFSGYSVLTFGLGLGIHIKNQNVVPDLDI
jgi:hypothetical protein